MERTLVSEADDSPSRDKLPMLLERDLGAVSSSTTGGDPRNAKPESFDESSLIRKKRDRDDDVDKSNSERAGDGRDVANEAVTTFSLSSCKSTRE